MLKSIMVLSTSVFRLKSSVSIELMSSYCWVPQKASFLMLPVTVSVFVCCCLGFRWFCYERI